MGPWEEERSFLRGLWTKGNHVKKRWCIYTAPFSYNMLKGALQWSVYPQRSILVLILPSPEGWKAEWTLAGKKVTQLFNPWPGRESNRGPQDWEAEILTLRRPVRKSCSRSQRSCFKVGEWFINLFNCLLRCSPLFKGEIYNEDAKSLIINTYFC